MNRVFKTSQKKKINKLKIFISIIVIWVIVLSLYSIFNSTYSYKDITYKTIKVSSGETLWDIARIEKANNEYYKKMEIRQVVNSIKSINSLESSSLYVNQELKIVEQ